MIAALALAAAVQGGGPTVGDTIWLRYEVTVPPGRTVRAPDWEPADPVQLLGPPRVLAREGSAEIAYPVAVWRTGEHAIGAPGPLLLGPGGGVDSLPPRTFRVTVASVLPAVRPDTGLRPQPRADFVARGDTTPLPLLLALLLAALLLAPLHWWWHRRGAPRPLRPAQAGGPAAPPLERWSDAGESRAVAAATTGRLRGLFARQVPAAHPGLDTEALLTELETARPGWPHREVGDLLRALDEARFGRATFPDAIGLARWAAELEPRLLRDEVAR